MPKLFVMLRCIFRRQYLFDSVFEFRNALGDRGPHHIRIDVEISMNEMVPHADDQPPRYARGTLSKLRGKMATGLADDLQPTDHPGLRSFIGVEGLATGQVFLDAGNSIQDIQSAGPIIPHAQRCLDGYGSAQHLLTDSWP